MSENELLGPPDDIFCESFDAEAEATARLQVPSGPSFYHS